MTNKYLIRVKRFILFYLKKNKERKGGFNINMNKNCEKENLQN